MPQNCEKLKDAEIETLVEDWLVEQIEEQSDSLADEIQVDIQGCVEKGAEIILKCENVELQGNSLKACCPAHNDTNPSMGITIRITDEGKVWLNFKCFSNDCSVDEICKALGITNADRLISNQKLISNKNPITVAELAEAKGLDAEDLKQWGVKDAKEGVLIPYGDNYRTRKRWALRAKDGSGWADGELIAPYGVWRLPKEPFYDFFFLVEGESDCWSAWTHDMPCLGIPGASLTSCLKYDHVKNLKTICVVKEPDNGGELFVKGVQDRLAKIGWSGELLEVSFAPIKGQAIKDVNEAHRALCGLNYTDDQNNNFWEYIYKSESAAKSLPLNSVSTANIGTNDSEVEIEKKKNISVSIPKTLTGSELLAMDLQKPVTVVDDLLVEGLNLLVGPAKLGKSWLALSWCVAVATGGRVLGQIPVEQGDAFYLGLEDSSYRLQNRIQNITPEITDLSRLSRLHLDTEWKPLDQGGLEDLANWLTEHPQTRLVVIDTLARVKPKGRGRNVYDEDTNAIAPLQKLAHDHHVAIVCVHHTNKIKRTDDIFDTVSGSTGLTGVADSILILKRPRGQQNAMLTVSGRDIEEQELMLSFSSGIWNLISRGEIEDHNAINDTWQEIVDTLETKGPLSAKELSATRGRTTEKERATDRTTYRRMIDAGVIFQSSDGNYSLAA